ncbi:immunoglobulin lambda-1 light chain-like [Heptranchias perlo]|uniref:immunoglobulin lambda-1 light chain-like n=1 Tax=Heptranchias perlo TaxID=212740 RepID=UPI0035594BC9
MTAWNECAIAPASQSITEKAPTCLSAQLENVEVTSSKVDQFPKHVNVARGANVSLFCTFPLFQDAPDVVWWRQGENKFLEPDNRKQFNVKKGSGSFDVVNVNIEDTGMYYCKVKHQEKSIGDGAGSLITVYVPPTPLEIAPVEGISSASLKLECKTAAFYPEHLGISWRRDGVEIQTGIETVKNRTAKGLYEVSTFLEDVQPARSGVVYTCLVSHVSLVVPAGVSYTFKGHSFSISLLMFVRLFLAFLVILALTGIIVDHVKMSSIEGKGRLAISASAAHNSTRTYP